jgi:ribonuclease R
MVHRALKRRAGMQEAGAAMPDRRAQVQQENALPQICRSSSVAERVAERAERDSTKVKMAELYGKHVGEAFSGTVSGVGSFGLYVRLDDTTAEGRVMRRDLGYERFHFDEGRMELVGEESGNRWGLGRRMAVRVEGVDAMRGWIDLAPADGTEPQGPTLLVGIR